MSILRNMRKAFLMYRHYGKVFLLSMCFPILLCACNSAITNPVPLNQITTQASNRPLQEYRIQPGDNLDVKFFYNKDLNEQIIVRPDGKISLQLVGELNAADLTPAQLTDELTRAYAVELNDPKITVIVRSFNSQRVYVDGEVNRPGLINLVIPTTALQSISQAGGLKDTARIDEIILIRRSADNTFTSTMLNLAKALDGTDMKQNIVLVSQDIIYVPKSHIANLDMWVDQYIRQLIPIPFSITTNPI